MFFDNWTGLLRVAVVGSLSYISLIILLRISCKRTLSKMNAFDLVVTVARGSTLATVLLSNQVALAEGVLALCAAHLPAACRYLASVRSKRFKRLIEAEPTMLLYRGEFLYNVMKRERVTEEESAVAVRREEMPSLDNVEVVMLEADGTFSIISRTGAANAEGLSSLEYVSNYNSGKGDCTSDGSGLADRS